MNPLLRLIFGNNMCGCSCSGMGMGMSNIDMDSLRLSMAVAQQDAIYRNSIWCGMPNFSSDASFLTMPFQRNTSMDFLLDPRLAFWTTQQQMASGCMGGFPGMGGFGGFAGMPGMPALPWMPQQGVQPVNQPKAETEEEKTNKKQVENIKKAYEKLEKIANKAEFKDKNILSEDLKNEYKEALKEKTWEKQKEALDKVVEKIKPETLKKAALSNDETMKALYEAGFNTFDKNVVFVDKAKTNPTVKLCNDVFAELSTGKSNKNTNLAMLSGQCDADTILQIVSTWNDTHNKSNNNGLLKLIGSTIPQNSSEQTIWKRAVENIALALETRAENKYNNYPKIMNAKKEVENALKSVQANFNQQNINTLSDKFDILYAHLRMMEAEELNAKIRYDNQEFNKIKSGAIPDDIVIAETNADLAKEHIAIPNQRDTYENEDYIIEKDDEVEAPESKADTSIEAAQKIDEETSDDPAERLKELSRGDSAFLKPYGEHEGIYVTNVDTNNAPHKLYGLNKDGDKLIEYYYDSTTRSCKPRKNAEDVSAEDIAQYKQALESVNSLISSKKIERINKVKTKQVYNLYRSTGKKDGKYQYFMLRDNKLVQLNGVVNDTLGSNSQIMFKPNGGTNIALSSITDDNVLEVNENSIYTKTQEDADTKAKKEADVTKVERPSFNSLNDLNNSELEKLGLQTIGSPGIKGYFVSKTKHDNKVRYYRYNLTTNKLVYLRDVKSITKSGLIIKTDGKIDVTSECISDKVAKDNDEYIMLMQEYGNGLGKDLNGITTSEEDCDAKRRLNTFTKLNDPALIVSFIRGYQSYGGMWMNNGLCKQIVTEDGFKQDGSTKDKTYYFTKRYYLKWIAKQMIKVVNETNFDKNSEDYIALTSFADGNLYYKRTNGTNANFDITTCAKKLDKIIEKVLTAYEEKHPPLTQQEETQES